MPGRLSLALLGLLGATAAHVPVAAQPAAAPTTPAFDSAARPVLTRYCVECHGPTTQKGDFRTDTLPADPSSPKDLAAWKSVLERVTAGTMPPAKKPRPAKADADAMTAWVEGRLAVAEQARQKAEGRVALRRLSRSEYEHTVRDLLGVPVDIRDLLPEDSISHGFDNLAEAQSLSPVQLQQYLEAAELALKAAVAPGSRPKPQTRTYSFATARPDYLGRFWLKRADGAVVFFESSTFPRTKLDTFRAWTTGRFRIRITGENHQSAEPIPFALYLGNFDRGEPPVYGYYEFPAGKVGTVEVTVDLNRGDSLKIIAYGLRGFNPYPTDGRGKPLKQDKPETYPGPGLATHAITVEGPLLDGWPSRGHKLLFGDLSTKTGAVVSANPEGDAKRLLPVFLSAAFRRPVTPEKAVPYLALFTAEHKQGATFQEAMLTAASAALCSPDFVFLPESPGRLDDYTLASRLSYFLWRSLPDDELLKLAAAGQLGRSEVLKEQTERLLKHPNARRFTTAFTDAWLDLRNIDFTTPDRFLYPEFDLFLQTSMLQETRAFVNEVFDKNLPASTFIASDWAMLNSRLATHYGIPDVSGLEVRRVPLPAGSVRGGLLSQGAVLKVSANGTTTSPVVRGIYVLERFLGTTPPPPPPGVPAVEPDIRGATTIRDQLAKHRSVETCAGCHRLIDPPGFALESFDPVGVWRDRFRSLGAGDVPKPPVPRTRYRLGPAVDASGELTDGRTFKGFAEFRALLLADQDRFARCLAEKLLTFATGREIGLADRPEVARLVAASAANKHAVRDLVHAVVQSEIFRTK